MRSAGDRAASEALNLSLLLAAILAVAALDTALLVATNRSIVVDPLIHYALFVAPFRGAPFTPERWREAGSCQGLTDWGCEEKRMG